MKLGVAIGAGLVALFLGNVVWVAMGGSDGNRRLGASVPDYQSGVLQNGRIASGSQTVLAC